MVCFGQLLGWDSPSLNIYQVVRRISLCVAYGNVLFWLKHEHFSVFQIKWVIRWRGSTRVILKMGYGVAWRVSSWGTIPARLMLRVLSPSSPVPIFSNYSSLANSSLIELSPIHSSKIQHWILSKPSCIMVCFGQLIGWDYFIFEYLSGCTQHFSACCLWQRSLLA